MARPQSEKVWLVSDLHRSQTLPNIFHHRPPPPPIARLPPPTPSTNIDFPPSAISSLSHHSIPLSTAYHRVSRDPLATARDRPRPPATALALSDLVTLPPPTRSLAHSPLAPVHSYRARSDETPPHLLFLLYPIMALEPQPPSVRKRVKVYELRDNDWFDRGTGFCTGQFLEVRIACPDGRA